MIRCGIAEIGLDDGGLVAAPSKPETAPRAVERILDTYRNSMQQAQHGPDLLASLVWKRLAGLFAHARHWDGLHFFPKRLDSPQSSRSASLSQCGAAVR